jgi:hypothetical protein
MKTKVFIICVICFNIISFSSAIADTILLKDGTYLVGKVIDWDAFHIIFKNRHGAFAIRKDQLVRLYISETYEDDIKLKNKFGLQVKDEDIKIHFESGLAGVPIGGVNREDLEESISSPGTDNRIFTEFSSYKTAGTLANYMESGYGISAGYKKDISDILADEYIFTAPCICLQTEFARFSGDIYTTDDYSFYIGPEWTINFPGGIWGNLSFCLLTGATYLRIESSDYNGISKTVSAKLRTGYTYSSGKYSISIIYSYLFVYDRVEPLKANGINLSLSYRL